jgi:hypothetical protein
MSAARGPLLVLVFSVVAVFAVGLHARVSASARRGDQPAIDLVVSLLPGPDLALAGGARHLRFPSLEDPGAAFADAPASADLDPAGGAMAPPTEVYADVARNAAPHGASVRAR